MAARLRAVRPPGRRMPGADGLSLITQHSIALSYGVVYADAAKCNLDCTSGTAEGTTVVSFLLILILLVALGGWLDSRLPWPRTQRA